MTPFPENLPNKAVQWARPDGQGDSNIGAVIVRVGFEGPLYHTYNQEPPKDFKQVAGMYTSAVTGNLDNGCMY